MKLSPALAYLAANPWAMEFGLFGRLSAILAAHAAGERADAETLAAIKSATGTDAPEPAMQWIGRTAVIPIRGALARYASSVNGFCQPQGRSADAVQADLMAAAERGAERIILRIDSPGGEVQGTAETAALVRQISGGGIPVIAFVDGTAASAAFWIASQADEIVASADTALVGSIGIAMSIGGGDGQQTVITSAPAKSGPVLNSAHLANARRMVVEMATAFADNVAAGRGLTAEQIAALATGETWTAAAAKDLGLVDRIATWDDLFKSTAAVVDPVAAKRRSDIARYLSSTVTVAAPAAVAASLTPAPAAITEQEPPMALTVQALAALAVAHAVHSTLILAEGAKPDATEASVLGAIAKADAAAKDATIADLTAKLTAAQATTAEATAAKAAAETALAALKAHAPAHGDPGPGDVPDASKVLPKFTKAQAAAGQIPAALLVSGAYELAG